jgi:hypothetical protein
MLDEGRLDMDRRTAEGEKDSVVGMGRSNGVCEIDWSLLSLVPYSSVRDIREMETPRSNCFVGISLLLVSYCAEI